MNSEACESCKGKGWIISLRQGSPEYPEFDNCAAVERCDECEQLPSDEAAALLAQAKGVRCLSTYPCVLVSQETAPKEWRIVWEIEVDADDPVAAAREAKKIQQDPTSLANCYLVYDDTGSQYQVDLNSDDPLEGPYPPETDCPTCGMTPECPCCGWQMGWLPQTEIGQPCSGCGFIDGEHPDKECKG